MIRRVKEAARLENAVVAVMLDMKGPELRVGEFEKGKVNLVKDAVVHLTGSKVIGTDKVIPVNYQHFADDVKPGGIVLLDDGLITLIVEEVDCDYAKCRVIDGGELSNHKGVNLPGLELTMPSLTESDYKDIVLGIEEKVNFIAISFVRKPQDVLDIRNLLEEKKAENIRLIAKIETQAGVNNFDSILEVVDAVMVARGDLGVEIQPEEVPLVQKKLIKQCNQEGKPVITATHMLDSMVRNPRPTRAEASDVANAIFDGTDAVMLSGETAIGKFPVETVETMARIAIRTEKALNYRNILQHKRIDFPRTITDAISHATCTIAMDLQANAV
jgi:pyruvate kinase